MIGHSEQAFVLCGPELGRTYTRDKCKPKGMRTKIVMMMGVGKKMCGSRTWINCDVGQGLWIRHGLCCLCHLRCLLSCLHQLQIAMSGARYCLPVSLHAHGRVLCLNM